MSINLEVILDNFFHCIFEKKKKIAGKAFAAAVLMSRIDRFLADKLDILKKL